jgi:hypothetical protein
MAESDDMREEMRSALTVALTIASMVQRGVVKARERARDDAEARVHAGLAEAQATAALESARHTLDPEQEIGAHEDKAARFGELDDPAWWETASAEDIAAIWSAAQKAGDSKDPDLAAAGRDASTTMSDQLRERYDIDPGQIDTAVDQQLATDQSLPSAPGAAPELAAEGLLAAGEARTAERRTPGRGTTSPEQRQARLRDSAPADAVQGALAVEDAFPHPTDQVHHSPQRRASGEGSEQAQAARRAMPRRRG